MIREGSGRLAAMVLAALFGANPVTSETVVSPGVPALEIRVGGAMEPRPHAVWIAVMPDGRVLRGGVRVDVPPAEALGMLDRLCASDLARLNADDFDAAVAALHAPPVLEGGTGVYTAVFRCGGVERTRTLTFPTRFADSPSPVARAFADLVRAAEALLAGHG